MNEDMYLSLAIDLFKNGTWSEEVFIKRVKLYAEEKNLDMKSIEEMINRLTNTKEYTIQEKRNFLSVLTISDNELKYGDVVNTMNDEMVEKFYEMEREALSNDKFELFHNIASHKNEPNTNDEIIEEEVIKDFVIPRDEIKIKKVWDVENEEFVTTEIYDGKNFRWNKSVNDIIIGNYTKRDLLGNSEKEKEAIFKYLVENVKAEELSDVANSLINKMEPSYCLDFTNEWELFHKDLVKKVWDIENEKFIPKFANGTVNEEIKEENKLMKSINDIIMGNYTEKDLLGNSEEEKEAIFKYLVENVKKEELSDVANSLMNKMEPSYCLNFTIEWEKFHKEGIKTEEENKETNEVVEEKEEVLEVKEDGVEDKKIIVPSLEFDPKDIEEMAKTEEEYKAQTENITKNEEDSNVREVSVSKERLEHLKKNKGKIKNYFLKTAIVVTSVILLNPVSSIALVGGYLHFATMIKKGNFNPENPVEKAIKSTVEKVMYIGMNKEEIENERGKTR